MVFDLDGTLLDSTTDIHASMAHALRSLGHPAPTVDELRPRIGRPLDELFTALAPGADVAALCAAYRAHFLDTGHPSTRPFPGAAALLGELRDAGWALAVATTKTTEGAVRTLTTLGLLDGFDHVQGTDGFPCKPAPHVVERALAGLGAAGDPAACWMVGDTVHDVAAGAAAGVSTAAVTHGAHGREALLACAADLVVDDLAALGRHLRALV